MSIENRSGFYKKMLTLALPIALQQLLTSCAQLIDTAMVVGLGNANTAAIGVAGRWGFLVNLALFGISSGVATMTAQHWGIKDYKSIHRAYGTGLVLAVTVGMIYTVCAFAIPRQLMMVFNNEPEVIEAGAQYLRYVCLYGIFTAISLVTSTTMRSTEDVHTPLLCSVIAVVTNTALNYILINGKLGLPALGLQGAAIATALSAALQAALMITIGYAKKSIVIAKPSETFSFEKEFFRKFLRVCLPVMFNELMWGIGTNVYAMVYARQGSEN